MDLKNIWHNDAVQKLSELLFDGILTLEHKSSKKKTVKIGDVKCYGFFFDKNDETYFIQDFPDENKSVLDKFPIRVTDKTETDFCKNVFYFVNKYESVKIPTERKMSFRQMVETISNFGHTSPKHFLLYKLITIAGYVNRINYRIIAEKSFGKDSVVNNIHDLVGDISNIYGATMAKLEYSLTQKHLILNELGNLKPEEKFIMQGFFLSVGAFANSYTKRSRAIEGTQENYNISKMSLGIIHNPPLDYIDKGQQYFDQMFTKAVINRFIPFYLEGTLTESFNGQFDAEQIVRDNMQTYKDVISTLLYYKKTQITNKYSIPDDIVFGDKVKRYERSFLEIAKYISEYSLDEAEFYDLLYTLYASYQRFQTVLQEAKMFEVETK